MWLVMVMMMERVRMIDVVGDIYIMMQCLFVCHEK